MHRHTAMLACLVLAATPAAAQPFPGRQVTIVSPYQAGGTSDIISRELAQRLSVTWKQSVVVENRPGANGAIGVNAVAKGPADGHLLLAVASSALTLNPLLLKGLAYDVARDLAPVTRTGRVANVLVVHPAVAARSVAELVALAKANPGKLTYASQGNGSNGHLTAELFKLRAGVEMVHLPYKGSAPAVNDLVGGHTQLMFDNLPSVLGQIRGDKLRALAVTTAERSPLLSGIPTIAESGMPGFETSAWFAVLVAKGTAEDVRSTIEKAVIDALQAPDAKLKLAGLGVDVAADGAAELAKRIGEETSQWRDVVQRAGIRVDP